MTRFSRRSGEECAETIIAAKNGNKTELVGEINDVFYHMMVMMNECGVTMEDVCKEMDIRAQKNRQPEEIRFRPQYLIFIPKLYTPDRALTHEITFAFANAQKKGGACITIFALLERKF